MNIITTLLLVGVRKVIDQAVAVFWWLQKNGPGILILAISAAVGVGTVLVLYVQLNDTKQSAHTVYVAELTDATLSRAAETTLIDAYTGAEMEFSLSPDKLSSNGYLAETMARLSSLWLAEELKATRGTCVVVVVQGVLWNKQLTRVVDKVDCPARNN